MMYEDLFKKLIGEKIRLYFSRDFYVDGMVLDVDEGMVKLKTEIGFVYVEFIQEIKGVATMADIKLEERKG